MRWHPSSIAPCLTLSRQAQPKAGVDFNCDSEADCHNLTSAAGVELVGTADIHKGRLRLTRQGDPALSSTTIGYENVLQPLTPGRADPRTPDTTFDSGSAIFSLPPGTHVLQLQIEFNVVVGGIYDVAAKASPYPTAGVYPKRQ